MKVGDLCTGDNVELKGVVGYILEATHCEHGMSKITWRMGDRDPYTKAYLTDYEITSGLVVLGSYMLEEEITP